MQPRKAQSSSQPEYPLQSLRSRPSPFLSRAAATAHSVYSAQIGQPAQRDRTESFPRAGVAVAVGEAACLNLKLKKERQSEQYARSAESIVSLY